MGIKLITVSEVKEFVTIAARCNKKIYVEGENCKVLASSIMGILSLDLSKPLHLSSDEDIPDAFLRDIDQFIIK